MRWFVLVALGGCGPPRTSLLDPAEALFRRLDADGSGGLSADELRAPEPERLLPLLDRDRDGLVSLDELRADLDAPAQGRGPRR